MRTTGRSVARLIANTLENHSVPVAVKDIAQRVLLETGHGSDEADARAQALEPRIISELQALMESEAASHICFNTSSSLYVQGLYYVEPTDDSSVASAKRRRQLTASMVDHLATLTPTGFEVLCGRLLGLLGCRQPYVTRRSSDQGIDFFALLVLGDIGPQHLPFLGLEHAMSLWIVGQAKHYPTSKVSTYELRELAGSVHLARSKAFATTSDIYQALNIRPNDPVLGLFLTTGDFTRDSKILADNSGLLAKGGIEIAEFLLDRGIGVVDDGEQLEFAADAFQAWLDDESLRTG